MDVELLREKLNKYINIADERHLTALYVLLIGKIPPSDEVVAKLS